MENGQAQPKQTSIRASKISGFIDSPLFFALYGDHCYIESLECWIERIFADSLGKLCRDIWKEKNEAIMPTCEALKGGGGWLLHIAR